MATLSTELYVALIEETKHGIQVALMRFLSRQAKRLRVWRHVYVVGGAVRNFVINEPIKDVDLMIDAVALKGKDAAWFAKNIARSIPAKTNLVTNQYGVAILSIKGTWVLDGHEMKGETIDIATARKEDYGGRAGKGYKPSSVSYATAEDDIGRREFTFNTLMWRLSQLADGPDKAEIIDITGCGLSDLKSGVMKCPSDPDKTFSDDPTRMLRAIKFMVRYGFRIEAGVARSIRRNAKKLKNAPHEAIASLLVNTILKEKTARKAIAEMKRLGLLDVVADMLKTNRAFRTRMQNWASDQRLAFLFDLMDMGLPLGARVGFLTPAQQDQFRRVTVAMSHKDAEALLVALKQPSAAFRDSSFIPSLARSRGVSGSAMSTFMPAVNELVRKLLLDRPELMANPAALRKAVAHS